MKNNDNDLIDGVNQMYEGMTNYTAEVESFFRLYAREFNAALGASTSGVKDILGAFADEFIVASPAGVKAGFDNESLKVAINNGLAFYRSLGIRSMELRSSEITVLDPVHALVKIRWSCVFSKSDRDGEIPFFVFYLVQRREDACKIFAYITGDEHKALVDNGLISES